MRIEMIEPVKLADFFITFFSAASVIIFGALYALLFAYSKIKNVPRLMLLAYAAYAVLFVSVMVLANVANLFGSLFWQFIVLLMLAGYLLAPRFIFQLCVATHESVADDDSAVDSGTHSPKTLDQSVSSTFHQPSKEKAL
jgi:FlaA1/EpsC-like NDP-sugar epimerase